MDIRQISMADYAYELPESSIAYVPLAQRDESKLLVWDRESIQHDRFYNLAAHLPAGSLIIFNKTKVIAARLFFLTPERKKIELFLLEPQHGNYNSLYDQTKSSWKCMVGGLKKWKNDESLFLEFRFQNQTGLLEAKKINTNEQFVTIEFSWNTIHPFIEIIHAAGAIPLPPYIKRESDLYDKERYQTIYAENEGSVAAPTAGLHFTEQGFKKLKKQGIETSFVTLHVGAGTFKPVHAATIGNHEMHEEYFEVDIETVEKLFNQTNAIVAVGTTSLRTLESLFWIAIHCKHDSKAILNEFRISQWEHLQYEGSILPAAQQALGYLLDLMKENSIGTIRGKTSICITPGYTFKLVDMLITNFHQPQSTLLLLIAAIMGDDWKRTYTEALAESYRFLSYGDSSLLKIVKTH